ncbi:MAG: histidine ammonia-lyase [Actinobacteria bacterium]|nr:histidine ammonia-lyase [Actinomycetota bacterium]
MLLSPAPLRPPQVVAVARDGQRVDLDPQVRATMAPARAAVERALDDRAVVYGVTTGFGALADTVIPPDDADHLQHALIRSHAAGMGPPVEDEVVRAMMLLRARTLAAGHTGARVAVVESLVALLNAGIRVYVPEHGSLGASGDLAPMAHVGAVLIGEGWVCGNDGRPADAADALAAAGLEPLALRVKDGLALLNATEGMLAMLVLGITDLQRLADTADLACALSVEALLATDRPYAEQLQELRPHPGQRTSAENLRRWLQDSPILASHRESRHAVQDAYSLRCAPQVHGAARDLVASATAVRDIELGASVDNPVVLEDGSIESCGNFHGQPLAFALDMLAMASAELGAISERRTDRLLDRSRSHGLPPFLATRAGVESGFMLAQYTAASLVAENRRFAVPASTDSIPTSGMQEDHVSLGWSAGRKLRRSLHNLQRILAIELLVAASGVEWRDPIPPGPRTAAVIARLRAHVPPMPTDRFLAADLEQVRQLVADGELLDAAEV